MTTVTRHQHPSLFSRCVCDASRAPVFFFSIFSNDYLQAPVVGFLKYYDHAEIKGRRAGRKTRRKGGTRTNGVFETQMCLDEPQVRFFPLHFNFFWFFTDYYLHIDYERLPAFHAASRLSLSLYNHYHPRPGRQGLETRFEPLVYFFFLFFHSANNYLYRFFFFSLIKTNIGREGNSRGDEKDINGARDAS